MSFDPSEGVETGSVACVLSIGIRELGAYKHQKQNKRDAYGVSDVGEGGTWPSSLSFLAHGFKGILLFFVFSTGGCALRFEVDAVGRGAGSVLPRKNSEVLLRIVRAPEG